MNNRLVTTLWVVLVLAVLGGIGYLQWQRQQPAPTPAPAETVADAASAAASAVDAAASEPAVRYPIEEAPVAASAVPFAAELPASLAQLLGREAVLAYLQTDDFARRFVATVDNLGREQAPSRLWPVNPTAGRFAAGASNARRYDGFVRFIGGIDNTRAAAWYVQHYAQFQRSWVELGFGRRQFNDRLVEVIDLLLATPEPSAPPAVHLTEVKGPIKPVRPWVTYEFADASLETLASGQKILLRMGPAHERELKARLRQFRALIAR